MTSASDLRRAGTGWDPTGGPARVAAATGGVWTIVMLARLFVGGTIGMADQGDSRRLMCQLGVRAALPFTTDPSRYVNPIWVAHRWYGEACGADGSGEPYRSTELFLLRITKALTTVLHFRGTLDLRLLGVICSVVVGAAIAGLVLVLPGSLPFRVIVVSLVGLAAADASVAEYFVSAYSEPAALVGLLVLCVALLSLWRRGSSTWPRLIVVAAVATFTMLAKTQTVALLPAVLFAVLWLPHQRADPSPSRPDFSGPRFPGLRRAAAGAIARGPAVFVAVLLVVASAVYIRSSPKRFSQVASYDQVFLEILPNSPNPRDDLRALGVDPSLASSSGASVLDPRSAAALPQYLHFRDTVTETVILKFYATHPSRLVSLGAQGLRAITVWRQTYLGTYTAGSGQPPGARECRVCIYNALFGSFRVLPLLVPLLWLLTLLAGIRVVRDPRLEAPEKALGRLAVFIVVAAVSDLYKHMIFTNLLTALCIPTIVGSLWVSRFRPTPIELPARTPSLWGT